MTNTKKFAVVELDILSKSCTDPENRPLIEPFRKEIFALCEKFGKSGQSGGSAPYTATCLSQAIKHLLLQEPICPIMNYEQEWEQVAREEITELPIYQNKRCSALFKVSKIGMPYYLDAIVWKDVINDNTFTGKVNNINSAQFVKEFPFTPKTFYIDVNQIPLREKDEYDYEIQNLEQLKKVWKYYTKSEF